MKIFFLCSLAVFSLFAGREFIQSDLAREKLRDMICQLYIIRVQMNFGVTLEDFERISIAHRIAYIKKFNDLWTDFRKSKEYFYKNFTTVEDKTIYSFCAMKIILEKVKYDKELAQYQNMH
ncbi:hypothetical protein BH09DEP1_BH09DEP1_5740 [soil metagenome]